MIEILKPGLFSTIQDLGRPGYRRFGIPVCGVMDSFSATLANWLVENKSNAPVLEVTMTGPELKFTDSHIIGLAGADISAEINGIAVPLYESLEVNKGDILTFGQLISGYRLYIAVAGGFNGEYFLNSSSTYTLAEKGGIEGRILKTGDNLQIKNANKKVKEKRVIPEHIRPKTEAIHTIRYIPGPETEFIDEDSPMELTGTYKIHPQSDRMGIRLSGFFGDVREKEIISSPVNLGTIQLLPDDDLVVLMNDGQVSGGYPRLGNIITADLHLMAQLKFGDQINLMQVSVQQAEKLALYQHKLLRKYNS